MQFVRDHYAPKFPELDSLVLVPLEYMRVVKAIGNETVWTAAGPKGMFANANSLNASVVYRKVSHCRTSRGWTWRRCCRPRR